MWNFGSDPRLASLNTLFGCSLKVELQQGGVSLNPVQRKDIANGQYSFSSVRLLEGSNVTVKIFNTVNPPFRKVVGSVDYNLLPAVCPATVTMPDLQLDRTFTVSGGGRLG